MKRIIVLWGAGSRGKTETLNFFISILLKNILDCEMPKLSGDKQVSFIYNEKIISICTKGDNEYEIAGNIDFFEKSNCDIAICASRTSGKTCEKLEKFAKSKHIEIEWIEKEYAEKSREKINIKQAQEIFDLLK